MTLAAGYILNNRYRIDQQVAQGGFGAVYRGWDLSLERPVAVKGNVDAGADSQRQFEREAKLLARLRHPNLPVVIDHFILPNQGQYLVMDFVEGVSLGELLARRGRPLEEAEVLYWTRQVCDALTYLHTRIPPVIHRDIKPDNIIITAEGRAMLVDFGISKVYEPSKGTTVGARAVTPGYSPLEQYGRGKTDARSDIYSLGATLYTLLTGQVPPDAPDLSSGADVLPPPRQINRALSEQTSRTIMAALTLPISQRLPSAADLSALLVGSAPPRPHPKPAPTPSPPPPASRPRRAAPANQARQIPVWGWALGALAGIVLLVWVASGLSGGPGGGGSENALLRVTQTVEAVNVETPRLRATSSPTAAPALQAGDTRKVMRGDVAVEQVYVPDGVFWMGSVYGGENELPRHVVTLDSFWLDKTEVTNGAYEECVEDGICRVPNQADSASRSKYYGNSIFRNYPVIYVSWVDAERYCRWANGRLPTEAEWEFAARGPTVVHYPWGNDSFVRGWANIDGLYGDTRDTTTVGSIFRDSSWVGVIDLAGNVREWVGDWYGGYNRNKVSNPTGPSVGNYRVLRGGAWHSTISNSRSASRPALQPDQTRNYIGFRCVQH